MRNNKSSGSGTATLFLMELLGGMISVMILVFFYKLSYNAEKLLFLLLLTTKHIETHLTDFLRHPQLPCDHGVHPISS